MENKPEYVGIWLGLSKIGVVTALVNNNLKNDPLLHSINVTDAKGLIFGSELSSAVSSIKDRLGIKLYQFKDKAQKELPTLEGSSELHRALDVTSNKSPSADIALGCPSENLMYIYTSGTTGLPKAAVIKNMR